MSHKYVTNKATFKNESFLSKLSSTLMGRKPPESVEQIQTTSLTWHKTTEVKERIKTATGTIAVYDDMSEEQVEEIKESVSGIPGLYEPDRVVPDGVAAAVIADAAMDFMTSLDGGSATTAAGGIKASQIYVATSSYLPEDSQGLTLTEGQKVEFINTSSPNKRARLDEEGSTQILDNSAAKYKMSIRPKKNHPSTKARPMETHDERWLVRDMESGQEGLVPPNILELSPSDVPAPPPPPPPPSAMPKLLESTIDAKKQLMMEIREKKPLKRRKSSSRMLLGPTPEDEARSKRTATIRELIETEEEFARDLQYVMDNYYSLFEKSSTPRAVRDHKDIIFNNFKYIAEFHQRVLIEGVKYNAETPRMIGKTFSRLERDFDQHAEYCSQEPLASEFLANNTMVRDFFEDFSQQIGDDKRLEEHLKLPIQRLNDYQLLLKELVKFGAKLGDDTADLDRAYELMQTIPQRATDSKFIASIEGFKGNLFKLGRLIRHDWFTVSEVGHKPRDRYLFLFKARILITKVKRISDDRSVFILKDIIRLPETSLEGLDLPKTLEFQHIEPQNHPNYPIVLEAKTSDIRDNWLLIVQEHVVDTASVEDLLFDDEIRVVSQEGEEEDRGDASPYGEDLIEDLPEDLLRDLPEPEEIRKDQVVPEAADFDQDIKAEFDTEESFWAPKKEQKKVENEPVVEDDFWSPKKKEQEVEKDPAVEDDFWAPKKEKEVKKEVVLEDDFWAPKKEEKEVEKEPAVEDDFWAPKKEAKEVEKEVEKEPVVEDDFWAPKKEEKDVEKEPVVEDDFWAPKKEEKEVEKEPAIEDDFWAPKKEEKEVEKEPVVEDDFWAPRKEEKEVEKEPVVEDDFWAPKKEEKEVEKEPVVKDDFWAPIKEEKEVEKEPILEDNFWAPKKEEKEVEKEPVVEDDFWAPKKEEKEVEKEPVVEDDFWAPKKEEKEVEKEPVVEDDFWASKKEKEVEKEPVVEDDFWAPKKEEKDVEKEAVAEDDFWAPKKEEKEVEKEPVVEDDFWSHKNENQIKESKSEISSKRSKEVEVDIWSTSKESPPLKKRSIKSNSEEQIEIQTFTEQTTVVESITNQSVSTKRSQEALEEEDFWSSKPASPPPKKKAFSSHIEESETVVQSFSEQAVEDKVTSSGNNLEKDKSLEQVEKTSAFKAETAERIDEVTKSSKKDLKQETPASDTQGSSKKPRKKSLSSKASERKKSDSLKEKDTIVESKEEKATVVDKKAKTSETFRKSSVKSEETYSKVEPILDTKEPVSKKTKLETVPLKKEEDKRKESETPLKTQKKSSISSKSQKEEDIVEKKKEKEDKPISTKKQIDRETAKMSEQRLLGIVDERTEDQGRAPNTTVCSAWKAPAPKTGRPVFTKTLAGDVVEPGDSTHFECEVEHDSNYYVTWLKNNKALEDKLADRVQQVDDGRKHSLKILNCLREDSGTYIAKVTDTAGSNALSTAHLLVQELSEEERAIRYADKIPFFMVKMKPAEVIENSNLSYAVHVCGDPMPTVTFMKDNVKLIEDERIQLVREVEKGHYELVFTHVLKSDAGMYKCIAMNRYDHVECQAMLTVQEEELALDQLSGKGSLLQKGEHADFTWFRDGQEMDPVERFNVMFKDEEDTLALVFQNVTPDDAGIYTCVAATSCGKISCSAELTVEGSVKRLMKDPAPPVFIEPLQDTYVSKGGTAMLECTIEAYPKPTLTWLKCMMPITVKGRYKELWENDECVTLIIKNIEESDKGMYTCQAENEIGEADCSCKIGIKCGPRIKKMEREIACNIGKPLEYVVMVEGEPLPEIQWMKNGQPIKPSDRIQFEQGDDGKFVLKIDDMKDSDCGNYTVLLTNDMGQRSENFSIQAETVPIITKELDREMEKKIQNDHTFEVRCKGVPTPVATWYKDDKELSPNDNLKMLKDEQFYQLKIRKVDRLDRGTYKVVLRNSQGEAESSTVFLVRAPPFFITPMKDACARVGEKAIKLFVQWEANPRPTVRWIFKDKPIGEDTADHSYNLTDETSVLTIKEAAENVVGTYQLKASNEYGDSVCKARFRLHCTPEIIEPLKDSEFLEEATCKFSCKVHGVPVPDIKWFKDTRKWTPDDKRVKLTKDDEDTYCISITGAKVEDSGRYMCVISNVEGKVEMEADLLVCTPPHILGSNFDEGKTYIAMHKLVLEVEASSVPLAEATWYCDGRELKEEEDSKKFSIFDGKFYRMEFLGSDPEQTGVYKCVLKNKISSAEISGLITIIEKEARVRQPLKDLFVKEFADGTIQAQIVGDPIPSVQWLRNGKPVPAVSDRYEIREDREKRMHYLTFKNVEEKDKSNFTLKGTNEHGECETTCLMTVWVKPDPGELQDTVVDFGKDLLLKVFIHAVPPPVIFWFQDGSKRLEGERIEYIRDEEKEYYSYKLKNVALPDGGTYSFTASNPAGEATGQSLVTIHTEKPTIVDPLEKLEICLEDSVTYHIKFAGLPLPEVTWTNKGVLVEDTERSKVKRLETDLYSMTISDLRMEDYGEISAIAKNLVGEAISSAKLVQKKLPCKIIQDLEHITKGPEGDEVTLKVLVQASPRPSFTWTKDGDVLKDGEKHKISFTKTNFCEGYITLSIQESTSLDSGQYRLRFKNDVNEVATETALIVRPERRKPRITKKPEDFSVTSMEPGIFKAKILGHPKPEVQWLKEGRIVLPTDICSTGVTADGFYYLEFKHVTMEDGGRYTVVAKNDEGQVDCEVVLTVEPPPCKPEFLQGLKPTSVIVGYPCRMEVQLGGVPKPTVSWLKDGEPVNFDGSHITEIITDDGTVILQIDKADVTDIGQYTAIAHNPMGDTRSSADLDVLGHERTDGQPDCAAHFTDGLRDSCFDEGKTIRLPVSVKGGPVPDMKWYKDGKEIELGDRVFYTYDGDKTYLEIRPCVGADSGMYKCVISNEHGEDATECEVSVRKCFEAPIFTQGFCSQQQLPGRDAKFSVKIDGVPRPEISWYFNGKLIKPDGDKYRIRKDPDGQTLIVKDCTYSDSGEFKCVATNREGTSEHAAKLEVSDTADPNRKAEAPVFLKVIGDQELFMNNTARFKAVVTGKPMPDFEWVKDGQKVYTNSRTISERDFDGMIRLTIMHVCEADTGTYTLKVWNEHGKASCKGKLICECLSKDRKRPVGDEYQGFDKLRRAGVPIPLPETPIISALSDRRATISWIPYLPAGPMPPVTYQVEMAEMPEGDYVTAASGIRGCSVDVTGLNPKSDYKFRVRVENRYGVSEPSPFVCTYRTRLERTPKSYEPYLDEGDQTIDGPFVPLGFRIDRDEQGRFYAAPRFLRLDSDTQYGLKDFSTRVKWIVYGYPTPKLQFYFNDKRINFTKHPRYTMSQEASGDTCLYLDKICAKDVGPYNCIATNEYGESHQLINLELSEYPQVTQHLQEVYMRSLTSGKISCKISGYPPCDVKWFKDWEEITPNTKLRPQFLAPDTYTLNFHGPVVKDAGLYSLAAVNVAGAVSSSCMVHVEDDDMNFSWTGPGRGRTVGINTKKGNLEDHYDVGDELGRGTQGVIYHCAEHYTGRNFAAKSMWGTDNYKGWMHMEYEMMNLVNASKYVVRLYDVYEGPKNMVLVEELCAGGGLLEYFIKQQYITEYEVAHYIRQILEGLDFMHDRQIGHCGLNLGDIMLTRPNGRDIKFSDLSLARNIRITKLHPLDYGMPEYVAPEIAKGENINEKVDMWAVGIITYILLAGSSPFRGEHDRETLTRIQKGELYFDEESFSHLSSEAKDFVGKLLQYKPDMRMDVKSALNHPWIGFSQMLPHDPYMIYTDRLRSYYSKYREWYDNASCRRWFRRRTLSSSFTHPSKMVYPPGEVYTPRESPCRELVPACKDLEPYTIPHRDLSYEIGIFKNESNYQQGPDTYLLQLRDPSFPVRLRQYMKVAEHRSISYAYSHRAEGFDYDDVPTVHERRRFTDIMDEQHSEERRNKMIDKYTAGLSRTTMESCSLDVPRRVTQEVTSRYSVRDDVKAIKQRKIGGKAPFFREKPQTTAITGGSSITLTVLATGEPEPVVQWYRNDVILGDTRIQIGTNGGRSQFTIPKCCDYDAGCYKVVARNIIGEATHRFRLVKAEIPGLCDPPEAVEVSGKQILLKWRTPIDDGGSHIECYHLQMKPKDAEDWICVSRNIPHEVFLVEDLEPNSIYMFRIACKNFMGWGEFSISNLGKTGPNGLPRIPLPLEQNIMSRDQKLFVFQLPGARGEIGDTLDYGREEQMVMMKDGEDGLTQFRKYTLESEMFRGEFSLILRAVRLDDQRTFACKVLLRTGRESYVAQEFDMLKSLRHERIAVLYEAFNLPNVTTFITEYLGGPDVLTYLSGKFEYTEQSVSSVAHQVIDALSYLNWRGYAHLDIQPDNIVLTSPRKLDVKLVDFANCRRVDKDGTIVDVITPIDYQAPEVLLDQKAHPNTDVWSLGVLIYVLLTGTSPFLDTEEEETIDNIRCVRFNFENLGSLVSQEATRFIMLVFKRNVVKRPNVDDLREHKWLEESDYMARKRERSILSTGRLREYATAYNDGRSRKSTITLDVKPLVKDKDLPAIKDKEELPAIMATEEIEA